MSTHDQNRMTKHGPEILMREVYECLKKSESIKHVHMPHSTVYYIRALIREKFGKELSLYEVEDMLKELGYLTKRGNPILTEEDKVRAHKRRLRRAAKKAGVYRVRTGNYTSVPIASHAYEQNPSST